MNREKLRKKFPETPQEIRDLIECEVQHQLNMQTKPERSGGGHRAVRSMRKTAVIAAAAVLAVGTTVFAGSRLYEIYMEKEGNYGVKTIVSAGSEGEDLTEKGTENPEVLMKGSSVENGSMTAALNWLPDGMSKEFGGGKRRWYYESTPYLGGLWLQGYALEEGDVFEILDTDIEESEKISLGEQEGIYLKKHMVEDGGLWLDKIIYIFYPEHSRVIRMAAGQDVTKEDAIKIAENMTLESGEDELGNLFIDWKVAKENMESVEEPAAGDVEEVKTEAAADQVKILPVGEPVVLNTFANDENGEFIEEGASLSACVTDVQVLDDISLLDRERIPDSWQAALDENGKLKNHTMQYVKSGDGINTVDEVVKTEELGRKLVYVTLEYTNTGDETLSEILYMASVCELEETEGGYRIYDRAEEESGQWDKAVSTTEVLSGEMGYYDVHGGSRDNNYIPSLAPGETVTVHVAFLVNEDELDKLYLNLCTSGGYLEFSEDALETGYVDIRK